MEVYIWFEWNCSDRDHCHVKSTTRLMSFCVTQTHGKYARCYLCSSDKEGIFFYNISLQLRCVAYLVLRFSSSSGITTGSTSLCPLLLVFASSSLIITQETTKVFFLSWQAVWEREQTSQADHSSEWSFIWSASKIVHVHLNKMHGQSSPLPRLRLHTFIPSSWRSIKAQYDFSGTFWGKHLFSLTVSFQSPAPSGCCAMFGGVQIIDCSPTVIKETRERGQGTSGTE